MNDIAVELGPVQETLLIPLLGRSEETRRENGLIHDTKAVEIVARLDYSFEKWRNTRSLRGATLRTRMFDEDVQAFLERHPQGTVVEIGCGLNTRFDRLDNGQLRWFDLDLPDVIELRRQFFEDRPRCTMLASSVLDTDWMESVRETGGPWCFVSEAVLIYLNEHDVRQVFVALAERFPKSWILTDTTAGEMVENQDKHDVMRHLSRDSWFRWACDDPSTLERWSPGLELKRSRTFLDASDELKRCLPWSLRLFIAVAPRFMTRQIRGYRLNRFQVQTAE